MALVGDLQIGSVGITTVEAEKHGIGVVSGIAMGSTRAKYFPGAGKIFIKLLFHDRYLIGAQIISTAGTKERIDGLALAIKRKQTVDEMLEMETCYSPVVSTLLDPLLFAVKGAYKKMPKRCTMIAIDGSYGEGGGQILRTAIALASITATDVRIFNIRSHRPQPGLKAQHMKSIDAAAKLCDAEVTGLYIGSQDITYSPMEIRG